MRRTARSRAVGQLGSLLATVLRLGVVRVHVLLRAASPYLPARGVAGLQRFRDRLNRSAGWRWLKRGGVEEVVETVDTPLTRVFDPDFYTEVYGRPPLGRTPLEHYLEVGWRRRRDPSPMFSTGWYLDRLTAEGHEEVEPLGHYLESGWQDGRDPAPWFSTHWYLSVNPDVGDVNPLLHYVEQGHADGRTVSETHSAALLGRHRDQRSSPVQVGLEEAFAVVGEGEAVPVEPRAVVGAHDLVSFDLWDTLVVRDRPADAAKVATARRMALAAGEPRRTWALYRTRVDVEATIAGEVVHEEYELTDVLARTIVAAGLDVGDAGALASELAEAELEDEIRGTVPVPETFEMLTRLARAEGGPAVVVLSDFYIGCDGLGRLLRHHGIDTGRVPILCSVDEGASKRLGTLFKLAEQRYGSEPSRHLHIGDNERSDGDMARAAGVDAIIVRPRAQPFPPPGSLDREWYTDAVLELEAELDEIAATTVGRSSATLAQRTAFAAGVRSSALVVALVAGAVERATELGLDTVYYLSREGAAAAGIHTQIAPVLFGGRAPRAVHLEVSRRSTFGPSLSTLDDDALRRMWSQYADQSPAALLASLGLEPQAYEDHLRRSGLDPLAVIERIADDLRVRQFLDRPDVSSSIVAALASQRELLLRYLDDRGFAGDRRLVVDVGWRGTIQDNLCHLFDDVEVHGVYVGLFPFLNPQPANATKRAVVFDGNRGERFEHLNPPAALEAPLTPGLPSVTGYVERDGRIEPVRLHEHGRALDLVAEFQAGLRLGAPTAARRYVSWGATTDLLRKGLQDSLRRYYRTPAPGVADIWFFSAHDDSFGAHNVTPYAKLRPGMELTYGTTEPLERPQAASSQWPQGWAAWLPVRALDVLRHQREGRSL